MTERGNGDRRGRKPRTGTRARRAAVDKATGALVLIGGACTPNGEAFGSFIRLSGAAGGAPIVGFTTASRNPVRNAAGWRRDFASAGAHTVEMPIVASRDAANDPAIAALVDSAAGIFLGGGDQVHLIATLSGTLVGEAIRDAFVRGAVVCGTSAGAAALTETTMAGGEIDEAGNEVEMYIGPGLGLLCYGTLIDTHFAQRRRLHRLFVAIAGYPQLLGLGIDEDTGLVVHGNVGEVVGKGGVTFVDGRDTVRFDNASQVKKGGELTLSHLRVGLVGTGQKFDLQARELAALAGPEPGTGISTGQVR
ncbi:MAG TPA: cyanophycinase [Gemmatimonadaceae bacterium]|nr:cyanophycinase [Gemmatimonadaceae bacterium]